MIKNWVITGDTHGYNEARLQSIKRNFTACAPEETAVIILGDAGFQYYKNKKDWKNKHCASKLGYTLYCLRGNHEDRISNSKDAHRVYDDEVKGYVWVEDEFPNIKYFDDAFGEYFIMGKRVLTIGGAYSVDKWYRLQRGIQWFADEQPSDEIKARVEERLAAENWQVDAVLTHTCPLRYTPTEAFLSFVDQSSVDNSTELWLDAVEERLDYKTWYCGHWHINKRIDKMHFLFEGIEIIE
jgi:3-oxoacid CoA-transferase subunit A